MQHFKPHRGLFFQLYKGLTNVPILSGNQQDNYHNVYKVSKIVVIITVGAMQAFTIKFSPFSNLIYFNPRGIFLHFSEP